MAVETNLASLKCESCETGLFKRFAHKNKKERLQLRSKCYQCPQCDKFFCNKCYIGQLLCIKCIDRLPSSINVKINHWAEKSWEDVRSHKIVFLIGFFMSMFGLAILLPYNLVLIIDEALNIRSVGLIIILYLLLMTPGLLLTIYFLLNSIGQIEPLDEDIIWYFAKLLIKRALNQETINDLVDNLKITWKKWRILKKIEISKLLKQKEPIIEFINSISMQS